MQTKQKKTKPLHKFSNIKSLRVQENSHLRTGFDLAQEILHDDVGEAFEERMTGLGVSV